MTKIVIKVCRLTIAAIGVCCAIFPCTISYEYTGGFASAVDPAAG